MSMDSKALNLPDYQLFMDAIDVLSLPISGSELHGVMCGYLCAGAVQEGEAYLRAFMPNKNGALIREAALALFGVFAVSEQQLLHFDFEFQLLLPEDRTPLMQRAQAFREWCDGFTQGLSMVGVDMHQFQDEETAEALEHVTEFAQLDYQSLQISEEDERALMEVNEYTRMAVLRIHNDLEFERTDRGQSDIAH